MLKLLYSMYKVIKKYIKLKIKIKIFFTLTFPMKNVKMGLFNTQSCKKIHKIKNKNKKFFSHQLSQRKILKWFYLMHKITKKYIKLKIKIKNFFPINFPKEKF